MLAAATTAGYRAGAALTWRLRRAGPFDCPRVRASQTETVQYWQQRIAPMRCWLVGSSVGDGLLLVDRVVRKAHRAR